MPAPNSNWMAKKLLILRESDLLAILEG